MSRSLPVWLLVCGLAVCVGCGGGAAPDSGAVASSGSETAPSGGTAMPTESSGGMEAPGGGAGMMDSTDTAGMGGEMDMDMDMYGAGGGPGGMDPANDPMAEMAEMAGAYGAGGANPGGASADAANGQDMADMAAAYGAGAEGYPDPGGATGTSLDGLGAEYGAAGGAEAYAGTGAEGAYPGGAYPGGPGGAVEEKVPEGFDGKAQLAFRRGKEKDAMQFLYAHALTTDAGAESLLPTIRWVGVLKQPKLAVRWGAGFVVTPRTFNGDPKPVGSQQKIPTRDGNRGEGAGGDDAFAGGAAADYATGEGGGGGGGGIQNSLLAKGAGELGEKLAAAYTERALRGDFGEVLKQALEARSGGNRGYGSGDGASAYGAGYGGADPGGAGAGYGAGNEADRGGSGGTAAAATQVTQIMPGLSMLGIGTQKELIDRAREDGIDAVVIIEVKLQVNTKVGLVTNDSTLALYDTKLQRKALHTTRKFNNLDIQKTRAAGKEDNVDKELEAFFEAIDANFLMAELPAGLTAEIAAKRVAALAAEKHENPLPILAEARMYHSKGLLEESALFAAYEQILGPDLGRLLATGSEEEKEKALSRWLPES